MKKLYTVYSVVRYEEADGWNVVGCEFGTRFIYDNYGQNFDSAYKMAKAFNLGQAPEIEDHVKK